MSKVALKATEQSTGQPSNFQGGDANFLSVNTFKCLGFRLKIPNLKNHSVPTFPLGTFLSISASPGGEFHTCLYMISHSQDSNNLKTIIKLPQAIV